MKKKSTRKPKAKAKPKKPPSTRDTAACLLVAEAAAEIKALDCAAFSLATFSNGDVPDDWRQPVVEAMQKFIRFGWAAFHAFGGTDVDWSKIAAKLNATLTNTSEPAPAVK